MRLRRPQGGALARRKAACSRCASNQLVQENESSRPELPALKEEYACNEGALAQLDLARCQVFAVTSAALAQQRARLPPPDAGKNSFAS